MAMAISYYTPSELWTLLYNVDSCQYCETGKIKKWSKFQFIPVEHCNVRQNLWDLAKLVKTGSSCDFWYIPKT